MASVVSTNPHVLDGTPVFCGTRVPVGSLFDYLIHGRTIDFFLEQFPTVKREQVELLLDEAKKIAMTTIDHGPEEPADEVEAAWGEEIARRIADIDSGRVKTIPSAEAERMIRGDVSIRRPRASD